MRCQASRSGYSGAISSKVRFSIPSVIFMMLAFVAHDDGVDAPAAVRGRHPWELARGTDVGVGLEELAERDVRALLAEADRGLEGPLQHDVGLADGLDRLGRYARGQTPAEDLSARLALLPRDPGPGGLDDALCAADPLGADGGAG